MSGFTDTVQDHALGDHFDVAGDHRFDSVERVFDPQAEQDQRQRRLSRIGILLIVGFFLPSLGPSPYGQTALWPQFSNFPGWNLVALAMFLPLLAGVVALVAAKTIQPPLRAVLLLVAGLSPLGLLYGLGGTTLLSGPFRALPATMYVWAVAALLLLVANRVRSYRPMRRSCYGVGIVGVACYATHLVLPVNGRVPIVEIVEGFGTHPVLMSGVGLHILFMAWVCWLTLRNLPTRNAFDASDDASRATRAWVLAAIAIGITMVGIAIFRLLQMAALTEAIEPFMQGVYATLKAAIIVVGFATLVPAAIADLWIGRT